MSGLSVPMSVCVEPAACVSVCTNPRVRACIRLRVNACEAEAAHSCRSLSWVEHVCVSNAGCGSRKETYLTL